MNNRVIMRNALVTDTIMVVLYMVTKPDHVCRVDHYEVDVQKRLRDVIYADSWVTDGVRELYRDYSKALDAYEQKQRDLAARIILGE